MIENLFEAIRKGSICDLKKVHENEINLQDDFGDSLLVYAVQQENLEIVKVLISSGANVNLKNNEGKIALHYCCEQNLLEIAELLITSKADLEIADDYGNQPLWTAVFNVKGNLEKLSLVELLLKNGSDKNHKNNSNRSPLEFANQVCYKPLIDLLNKY